jgi:Raf kinase inhibitor-like YbhB/YbcL family protein
MILVYVLAGWAKINPLMVSSDDFAPGGPMPVKCTCQGSNYSPRLSWKGAPSTAQTIAIICEDPDAPGGTWTHWVAFNLPALITNIAQNAQVQREIGGQEGTNSRGSVGYDGPCPPPGPAHRYYFHVFALDTILIGLDSSTSNKKLRQAMERHILAQGSIMGTFAAGQE